MPHAGPDLRSPFAIGGVRIPNRVVLGPMAGLTTSAFRRRAKAHGVGLVVTEMVSVYGLIYSDRRTRHYLDFHEEERPLAVQLFGDDPEATERAVNIVLEREVRPDLIDLNMGCPVRKVMKTGAGAALLADPARASAVAAAAVRAAATAGVPVTAKIRSGLQPGREVAVDVARRLEDVGIAAVGVHPRAASQLYRGRADHRVTAEVKSALSVPVLASGDIDTAAAALTVVEDTGADAVMVARGVQSGPWLISHILAGVDREKPPLSDAVDELLLLLALTEVDMGSERAARWMRKSLGWGLKGYGLPVERIETLRRCPDSRRLREGLLAVRP